MLRLIHRVGLVMLLFSVSTACAPAAAPTPTTEATTVPQQEMIATSANTAASIGTINEGNSSAGGDVVDNSVAFEILESPHIPEGSPRPEYNSDPPTSGPHYARWPEAGIYAPDATIPDEYLVHNLEHGHVWLSYRDASDSEIIDALAAIVQSYDGGIIMTVRPDNDSPVIAAAWGRVLKLESVDEEQIRAFIARYQWQAPERIP